MLIESRQYQTNLNNAVKQAWDEGNKNVLMVLGTGGGKTVCLSSLVHEEPGAVCVIAHRQELVTQISVALARNGIVHRIIGPKKLIDMVIKMHMIEIGAIFYDAQAHVAVAGVDTLIRRGKELAKWLPTVKLWVIDEAHHLQRKNKWGTAVEMFPNARGLGVTATALRADGGGLGAANDGEFHKIVASELSPRGLINEGFLTDYRIFSPDNGVIYDEEKVSKNTGDFSEKYLGKVVSESSLVKHSKSTVTGDVVNSYLKFAKDKLGITFVPTMEVGYELERQYNAAGVSAILVNAKTPADERAEILRKFGRREYLQLINVDLFGEGFDLPALEVVSMVRKTQSFGLFVQMFGRVLRLMIDKNLHPNWDNYNAQQRLHAIATSTKPFGIIIDHVNNVIELGAKYGLPDSPREWSLERRDKRAKSEDDENIIPLKACPSCTRVYERYKKSCPHCGYIPEPANRTGPEYVDGDLSELSPEILASLRGEVTKADLPINEQIMNFRQELLDKHLNPAYVRSNCKKRTVKLQHQHDSQVILRNKMAWWAGYRRSENINDDEIMKMFYLKYDIDWLAAQALPGVDADELIERIGEVS
jgi:superfamily II DNA or RNA helicase